MSDDTFKISLITVLAYYRNFVVNVKEMFDSLEVPLIKDPPTIKKGAHIDVKSIAVKSGTIISAKCGSMIKGLDPTPSGDYRFFIYSKKPIKGAELTTDENKGKGVYEFTMDYWKGMDRIHEKGFHLIKMEKLSIKGKRSSFDNQITINYAYKRGQNINMFIFKKNIKISGFQSEKYAIKMIKRIWEEHLLKDPAGITYFSTGKPSFVFESSMTNSTFETNYNFILSRVNTLMHELKKAEEPNSMILTSDFETTMDNGVKITLRAVKPDDYTFNMIVWDNDSNEKWSDEKVQQLEHGKKMDADDTKKSTISLYNEKYVISTRYGVILKDTFKYLDNILNTHKSSLEIKKLDSIPKFTPKLL